MSDVKWIKVTTDLFDNRKIRHLLARRGGSDMVVVWLLLLTIAGRCNDGGRIWFTPTIPYTAGMLARQLDMTEGKVNTALAALEELDMVLPDGSYLCLPSWEEHQNVEGLDKIREQTRLRNVKYRAKKATRRDVTHDVTGDDEMTPRDAPEKEEEKETETDPEKEKKKCGKKAAAAADPHTLFASLGGEGFWDEALRAKLGEWFTYKTQRGEGYNLQSMQALLRRLEEGWRVYGSQALCTLIDDCMANGWKSIVLERLAAPSAGGQPSARGKVLEQHYQEDARWAAEMEALQ